MRGEIQKGMTNMSAAEFQAIYGKNIIAYNSSTGFSNPLPIERAAKGSIRLPKPKKLSKPEEAFGRLAKSIWPNYDVLYEAITLRLASGCLWTPDFCVMDGPRIVVLVECKGSYALPSQPRSVLAFKEAMAQFTKIPMLFAKLGKCNNWTFQPKSIEEYK